MTPLESAAWPLACGGVCVFAISAVLTGVPWQVACAALAVAVAAWSLRAPLFASVVLAVVTWLLLTGLDVNVDGQLRFTGPADGLRLGVLIIAGLAGTIAGRLSGSVAAPGPLDDMPGPPEAYPAPGGCQPAAASESRSGQVRVVSRASGGTDRAWSAGAPLASGYPTSPTEKKEMTLND
jgi:hypothetical protein